MNTILLTRKIDWQEATPPRRAKRPGGGYLRRAAFGAGVETLLFVSVQALMIACVVVVAAQLFATA